MSKQETEIVKSPCVYICCLDEQDICMGCHRTSDEITRWGRMTNEERKAVLENVSAREVASGNIMKL